MFNNDVALPLEFRLQELDELPFVVFVIFRIRRHQQEVHIYKQDRCYVVRAKVECNLTESVLNWFRVT
jgi:hypothetical protein